MTDTQNEINDGSVKYETQSTAGGIGDVWVSGAVGQWSRRDVPRVKVVLRIEPRSASLQEDSMRMLCERSLCWKWTTIVSA